MRLHCDGYGYRVEMQFHTETFWKVAIRKTKKELGG